jgi:hypothetical protein
VDISKFMTGSLSSIDVLPPSYGSDPIRDCLGRATASSWANREYSLRMLFLSMDTQEPVIPQAISFGKHLYKPSQFFSETLIGCLLSLSNELLFISDILLHA